MHSVLKGWLERGQGWVTAGLAQPLYLQDKPARGHSNLVSRVLRAQRWTCEGPLSGRLPLIHVEGVGP